MVFRERADGFWPARMSTGFALAGALVCLTVTGCGAPPPPPPPPQAAAPPPKPIALDPIPEVVVKAGTTGTAQVEVHRAGHAGEITIAVTAPEGLTVTVSPIAGDARTGEIIVTATETLGTTETVMSVPVIVTLDGMTAQENLSVKVPPIEFPTFQQTGALVVQPGSTGTASFRIDRKGYEGRPIELGERSVGEDGQPIAAAPTETPREITLAPATVAGDAGDATLALAVAKGTADGPRTVLLTGSFMGRPFPAEVKLDVRAHPFRVAEVRSVAIAPGETRAVEVTLLRMGYAGPISIAVTDLPEGVTAKPVTVPADGASATIEFAAASAAEPRVCSATVHGTGGGFAVDDALVVRVRSPEGGSRVPATVMASPEAKRLMRKGSLAGRLTATGKRSLADSFGGTPESFAAIDRGLAWLARTQQQDGSWTLKGSAGVSAPDEPADEEPPSNPTAATALAILPFLGEGITHQRSPSEPPEFQGYQTAVERGLVFLARNQVRAKGAGDGFFGGGMTAHALATTAFCETYALSRDDRVKLNARQGLKCLLATQNDADGGWSEEPGQPSELSTTAFAVLALRSGQLAGLGVPARLLKKAAGFVESSAVEPKPADGPRYRATASTSPSAEATAAGLLSGMVSGWDQDEPALESGRRFLAVNPPPRDGGELGPLRYYFFATLALHSLEGDEYDVWDHLMRDFLIRLQRTSGDQAGSWDPRGFDHGKEGGRMEATALSLLALQVSHRHLPMYLDVGPAGETPRRAGDVEQPQPE